MSEEEKNCIVIGFKSGQVIYLHTTEEELYNQIIKLMNNWKKFFIVDDYTFVIKKDVSFIVFTNYKYFRGYNEKNNNTR